MNEPVIDASAVLCLLLKEPGAASVIPHLRGGVMSAVNQAEVMYRLLEPGKLLEDVTRRISALPLQLIGFSTEQAVVATSLKPVARQANLSFGDRACLALAMMRQAPVVTADRLWAELDLGIKVHLIR